MVAVGTGDGAVTGVALSAENKKRMNKNRAHKNSVRLNSSGVDTIQDFFWELGVKPHIVEIMVLHTNSV